MDSYTDVSGQCCGFRGCTSCAPQSGGCGCMRLEPMPIPPYPYNQNWTTEPVATPAYQNGGGYSEVMMDYSYDAAPTAPMQTPVSAPVPTPAPAPAPAPALSCPNTSAGPVEQHYPVAMAYVPWQQWQTTYPLEQALLQGTIFPDLDLQFAYGRCSK